MSAHVCFLGWCMIAVFYLKICLMGEDSFFAALEANIGLAGREHLQGCRN